MTHPYHALIQYEGEDWPAFLENIGLLPIFKRLFIRYSKPESTRKIIRYIVYTYSANSEKLIVGMDWSNNKKQIYDYVQLPAELWPGVGLLNDPLILQTVHQWLDFQGDRVFKQLQSLKDLQLEMQLTSNGVIKKASDEVDYDQKYRNANYARELSAIIDNLELQYIQNNPLLKDAVRETKFDKKSILTGPEHFS
jgi:hypothetical protein